MRLDAVRLRPELVTRGLAQRRERLDATWRLALSLDPRRPLSKGFALVTAGRQVVTSAASARAAGHMELTFQDGTIAVSTGSGVEPSPAKRLSSPPKKGPRAPGRATANQVQQDLFADPKEKE